MLQIPNFDVLSVVSKLNLLKISENSHQKRTDRNFQFIIINSVYDLFCYRMSKTDNQNSVDVDKMIHRLLESKGDVLLEPYQIRQVCLKAKQIFIKQPMLLSIRAPIKICGDVHGQYKDLLRIFSSGGSPSKVPYLFMGDYVDRGKNSLECIMLLFCFKIKFSNTFFMLRGNHQCSYINRLYGFYDECKRKSNLKVFKIFVDVFNVLPVAAVINKRIICMHGGLSPDITKIEQIQKIQRPTQVPQTGPLCDLLWSDPDKHTNGWEDNLQRGVSYTFGVDIIQKFLKENDLDVVCRAHQVVQQGFEFVGNRKLVTLFSAPNYCGVFDNDGAFMNVDQKLVCSFSIIKNKESNKENQHVQKTHKHSNISQSKKEALKKLTNQIRQKLFK